MTTKKILIVDDEAGFTRMVKLNLERNGDFTVREVNHAPAAIPAAREFKPDLILLDVIMPGMDGGDIRARLQADAHLKDIPVIFLTAAVRPGETKDGPLHSGGEEFLAKPVSLAVLVACIKKHLRPPAQAGPADGQRGA
ncbi:MAG: response regulator [Verrucomicrobia bacterium]|nr:response regulator [Verrucomicrobiota bacterium]